METSDQREVWINIIELNRVLFRWWPNKLQNKKHLQQQLKIFVKLFWCLWQLRNKLAFIVVSIFNFLLLTCKLHEINIDNFSYFSFNRQHPVSKIKLNTTELSENYIQLKSRRATVEKCRKTHRKYCKILIRLHWRWKCKSTKNKLKINWKYVKKWLVIIKLAIKFSTSNRLSDSIRLTLLKLASFRVMVTTLNRLLQKVGFRDLTEDYIYHWYGLNMS